MNPNDALRRWAYSFGILAGFVIVVAGLKLAQALIAPFLLAAFFAIIFSPPLYWLQSKRVPRTIAVLIVIVGFVGAWAAVATMITSSLLGFKDNSKEYEKNLKEHTAHVVEWLDEHGVEKADEIFQEDFAPSSMVRYVGTAVGQVGALVANAFLILLTVVFILLEQSSLHTKLRAIVKDPDRSLGQFDKMTENVRRYLSIKTFVSIITGVVVTILLTAIGVDYPMLWGLLAFLLNYIPTIGSYIAAAPAVLLSFIQLGTGPCLWTIGGYVAINVTMGNIVEPKLMGRGLGLSTLVVFGSLLFWGFVMGPVGSLLSVPLTMIAKLMLEGHEDTRWIAVLLGTESDADALLQEHAQQAESLSTTTEADQD